EGEGEEYRRWFLRMSELARKMPGYVSHKGYVAEDGERLTLFEWESADTLRAWATHPEHLPVQELGRQKFYTQYHLQVCELVRWQDRQFAFNRHDDCVMRRARNIRCRCGCVFPPARKWRPEGRCIGPSICRPARRSGH